MKMKLFKLILVVGVFSSLQFVQAAEGSLTYSNGRKTTKIIIFDKNKSRPVFRPISFSKLQRKAEHAAHAPIVYLENSRLADFYRSQPFLFGFLVLFTIVALGSLGFVFHLIRNDPRFY
jgi:hypothetical protein